MMSYITECDNCGEDFCFNCETAGECEYCSFHVCDFCFSKEETVHDCSMFEKINKEVKEKQ